ncbi:hypothetical protein [Pseudomonas sp. BF-B-26]|jgi:hypothetical protein|uniref:hypothetical protein n=1 Tax=Pseudomonas sp. BF-B-26 TaxID=2832400 RepID=UPI001CBE325B|nr:hypothetical protein [Pseudomonas sp. BF-B-26]
MPVERLLSGLNLPAVSAERKAIWNMSIDNPEETRYRKTSDLIDLLEELCDYVNDNSLKVSTDPDGAKEAFKLFYRVSFSSDYHKAGAVTAEKLYLEAASKGYPLMINSVREKLHVVIGEYVSLTYSSLLTLTGTLLP